MISSDNKRTFLEHSLKLHFFSEPDNTFSIGKGVVGTELIRTDRDYGTDGSRSLFNHQFMVRSSRRKFESENRSYLSK